MDNELTSFFLNLIRQTGSYDIAKSDFGRMIDDDPELKEQYAEWCEANGYSLREGFAMFCEDCINRQNDAMDSLNEFEEGW